jgi:hypothetical protein
LESSVSIHLGSINLAEENLEKGERFTYLIKSEEGLSIKYRFVDRKSNTYKNEDVAVNLNFGSIDLNWKPRTYNRFLRFVRYNKFKDDAY